jgi:hypothetical protein
LCRCGFGHGVLLRAESSGKDYGPRHEMPWVRVKRRSPLRLIRSENARARATIGRHRQYSYRGMPSGGP